MVEALNSYATLTAFRARLGLAATDTTDDARLLAKLRAASAEIEANTGRRFYPTMETRRFDYRRALWLTFGSQTLLELTAILNGDGTYIPTNAVGFLGNPAYGIELDDSAYFTYDRRKSGAISITGVWGYHPNYDAAWRTSGDSLTTGIDAQITTLSVNNASAADSGGVAPRFQVGQLIRIESEYLHVIGIAANVLTVVRGANRSVAVSHVATTPITIYTLPADLVEMTLQWAAWLLRLEDTGDLGGSGAVGYPALSGIRVASHLPTAWIDQLAVYCVVG